MPDCFLNSFSYLLMNKINCNGTKTGIGKQLGIAMKYIRIGNA